MKIEPRKVRFEHSVKAEENQESLGGQTAPLRAVMELVGAVGQAAAISALVELEILVLPALTGPDPGLTAGTAAEPKSDPAVEISDKVAVADTVADTAAD